MLVFVQRVRDKLNSRPRKIVGPQTPREVFFNAKKLPVALRRGTGPWNGRSCVKSGAGDKVEVLKPGKEPPRHLDCAGDTAVRLILTGLSERLLTVAAPNGPTNNFSRSQFNPCFSCDNYCNNYCNNICAHHNDQYNPCWFC